MMKRLLLLLLALWASPAAASICPSVPYTFVNGPTSIIDATQMNANFTAVLNCFNTGVANSGANSNITSLSALTFVTVSGAGTFGTIGVSGDITSSGTGEWVLPVGTTAQRSILPVSGMIRYNSTTLQYEEYNAANGGGWYSISGVNEVTPKGRLTLTTGVPVLS